MIRDSLSFFSFLLLAAHGLRQGSGGFALLWVLAAGLIFVPWRWKYWGLAALLGAGGVIWVMTISDLVSVRLTQGLPWGRLVAILGSVALFSFLAAVMQLTAAWKNRDGGAWAQGLVFMLTIGGLTIAKEKSPLTLLLADRFFMDGGWPVILLLGVYAAFILGTMLDVNQTRRWRHFLWSLFSAVFFVQLLLGLAGIEKMLMTGRLHLPVPALIAAGPLYRGDGFFMIILFTVTILLAGPAWCSHLCYIGAWDNLAATAQRKSRSLPSWTTGMRWALCLAVLTISVLLGQSGLPTAFALGLAAAFGLVGVGLMFTWSRRTGTMTHCIRYCPMGLLANISGRINPWRIRVHADCNECGRCSGFCRYDALRPADLAGRRAGFTCTLCGDCLGACVHNHLHYTFPGLSPATARTAFLVVAVSLHAIFLGVARL